MLIMETDEVWAGKNEPIEKRFFVIYVKLILEQGNTSGDMVSYYTL